MHGVDLLSGPVELVRRGMAPLAIVVVFATLIAPFAKLLGTACVLDPPAPAPGASRHATCAACSRWSSG